MRLKRRIKGELLRFRRFRDGGTSGRVIGSRDWPTYMMNIRRPFVPLEPDDREVAIVADVLTKLSAAGMLPTVGYDLGRYQAMRRTVEEMFEIPWTAITPRMQRLIYAINAIHRPRTMIAAGVFCGNTFISNAGAAVGPGAVYSANSLIGLEINEQEAQRAERNVRAIDPSGVARIIATDAVQYCEQWSDSIDLLYLDADGDAGRGKSIYLEITRKAWDKIPRGGLLLAHNSVNSIRTIRPYLDFVRDTRNCRASFNVVIDQEGLEVSQR